MEVHNVVEVSRSASFSECSELLSEQLVNGVTGDPVDWEGVVAVGVADGPEDRRLGQDFVAGDIELDLRERSARLVGPRYAILP
jgi:hypothetical protein